MSIRTAMCEKSIADVESGGPKQAVFATLTRLYDFSVAIGCLLEEA